MKKGTRLVINHKLKGRERADYKVIVKKVSGEDILVEFTGLGVRMLTTISHLNELIIKK